MSTATSTRALEPAGASGPTRPDLVVIGCGVLSLAAGVLVPGSRWLDWLGAADGPELVQGATLFRMALVVVGIYALAGWRLRFWSGSANAVAASAAHAEHRTPPVVVLLVAAAAALRLYHLEGGLWIDEVSTLVSYAGEPFGRILTTYDSQNQHMLYSLLAHASFLIFGEGSWALRLPAALLGIGSVWALYLLGREITSEREAVLATAVLAFSYQHIWFSQNARGYTGLLLCALLSTWLLLRALRAADRRLWLAYAVVTALGVFIHQTMLFVVAGQFVVYVTNVLRRGSSMSDAAWVPFAAGFVPAGLLTIATYALVLPQFPKTTASDVSTVQSWLSPLWTLREIVIGLHLGPLMVVGAVVGAAVVLLGLYSYLRRDPAIPILLLVPAVTGAVVTVAFSHPIWPRFFFFAAGFAILVLVRGITEVGDLAGRLFRWTPQRSGMAAICITMLAIAAGLPSFRYVYAPKQDFVGAREFVDASRGPGDAVVTVGVATDPFRRYFAPSWAAARTADEVVALGAGKPSTWLVYTLPTQLTAEHPDIQDLVTRAFTPVREFGGTLGGGTIYVYRADHLTGR